VYAASGYAALDHHYSSYSLDKLNGASLDIDIEPATFTDNEIAQLEPIYNAEAAQYSGTIAREQVYWQQVRTSCQSVCNVCCVKGKR
jgi:predicted acetyltransferase